MRPSGLSLLLALALACTSAAANSMNASDLRFDSDIDVREDDNGTFGVTTSSAQTVSDDYADAVIFSMLTSDDLSESPTAVKSNEVVFDVVAHKTAQSVKEEQARLQAEKMADDMNKSKRIFRVRGYCRNQSEIEVNNIQSYAIMPCTFSNKHLDGGDLMISLNPAITAQALIGEGIQIVNGDDTYQVKKGVVMNNARTSINISNFYNDIMGEKLLATGIQSGSDVIMASAQQYLDDTRASRTTTETQFVNGGVGGASTPVISTNTEAPRASDYLLNATIQLASVVGKAFGKAMEDDITYLFKVYPDTQLYVDLIVERVDDNDAYTEEEYKREFESGDGDDMNRPKYPVKQKKGEFFDTNLENETKE